MREVISCTFFFCAGKEFYKKVYYCELCKFKFPPRDDFELKLNLHCRNHVHIQRYELYCNKKKTKIKINERKGSVVKTNLGSNSSNKVRIQIEYHDLIFLSIAFYLTFNYFSRALKIKIKMIRQIMMIIEVNGIQQDKEVSNDIGWKMLKDILKSV